MLSSRQLRMSLLLMNWKCWKRDAWQFRSRQVQLSMVKPYLVVTCQTLVGGSTHAYEEPGSGHSQRCLKLTPFERLQEVATRETIGHYLETSWKREHWHCQREATYQEHICIVSPFDRVRPFDHQNDPIGSFAKNHAHRHWKYLA